MHHAHDCQCGGEHHHGHHEGRHGDMHHRCGCGCHEEGNMHHRRFFTREERISHLEAYLQGLEAEAEGVREHLAELRKG